MPRKPSGRFVIRITPELHDRLRRSSSARGVSLNARCAELLSTVGGGTTSRRAAEEPAWLPLLQSELGASLVGIVLFGSQARGDARPGSDTDLLVVVTDDVKLRRELYTRWDERLPPYLSPHFVHLPADAAGAGVLWLEASIDGILLHDTSRKVATVLAKIRRALAEGRLVRRSAHGHPYWIRRATEEGSAQ
jgi:predicted nucleotidyltransferase